MRLFPPGVWATRGRVIVSYDKKVLSHCTTKKRGVKPASQPVCKTVVSCVASSQPRVQGNWARPCGGHTTPRALSTAHSAGRMLGILGAAWASHCCCQNTSLLLLLQRWSWTADTAVHQRSCYSCSAKQFELAHLQHRFSSARYFAVGTRGSQRGGVVCTAPSNQ